MPDDRLADEENDRLTALEERVETLDKKFDNKLEDVRDRVVQVKHETDEKAEEDHAHEDLADRLDELEELLEDRDATEAIEDLEATLEEHTKSIDAIEDKIDMLAASMVETQDDVEGLAGIQEDVDELDRAIDGVNEEVELLASSLLEIQDRLGELNHTQAKRDALSELLGTAAEADIQRANCEACDTEVELGFLMEPACPGCDATFVDVEAGGILRSAVLRTGTLSTDTADDEVDDTPAQKSEFLGADVDETGAEQETRSVPHTEEMADEDDSDESKSFEFGAEADETAGETDPDPDAT